MREVVDHYFPPVNTLVKGGGEEYTDFTYWREPVLDIDEFSDSESDEKDGEDEEDNNGSEDEDDDEGNDELGDSYISRDSIDDNDDYNGLEESILSGSIFEDDQMTSSMLEEAEAEDEEARASGEEAQFEEDSTRVVAPLDLHPIEDQAAEAITGVKGLAREESDDKKV